MDAAQPSPIAPEAWQRMLAALDAGAPQHAACRYAGINPTVWERERQCIPEFGIEADRIEATGLVAAWRFLQGAAATEWRASLELIKLYGATRGREALRLDGQNVENLDAEITPDDVAAVLRILRANGLGEVELTAEVDGHPNGHAAGSSAGEAAE